MQPGKKNHMSELIFTITLFSLFLILSVLLVLFGANIYQKISAESSVNETMRTSISYIQEKVRQCDHEASVQVENHDGIDTLALHTSLGTDNYVTYIYYYDGSLKELFTKSSLDFNPSAGNSITDISAFSITKDSSLIHIILTDTNNQLHELFIHASSAMQ